MQNNAFEVAPNFASITECQIQAKNSNVSSFFTRSGLHLQAFKYLQIYFKSTKFYWQNL